MEKKSSTEMSKKIFEYKATLLTGDTKTKAKQKVEFCK